MANYIDLTSDGKRLPAKGKADFILKNIEDAKEISTPTQWEENLVCVVENPFFDAAGYADDERQMNIFLNPRGRKTRWLIVPNAKQLSELDIFKHIKS